VPSDDEHRHCKVCGRVCGVDDQTCSRACEAKRERAIRSRRNLEYLLYASIALVAIVAAARFI
jgi:predicted nucleic acid-binding Zn ribbon protein